MVERTVGVHMATPGLVSATPWNHVDPNPSTPFETASKPGKTWMAGTSPAMTYQLFSSS